MQSLIEYISEHLELLTGFLFDPQGLKRKVFDADFCTKYPKLRSFYTIGDFQE